MNHVRFGLNHHPAYGTADDGEDSSTEQEPFFLCVNFTQPVETTTAPVNGLIGAVPTL